MSFAGNQKLSALSICARAIRMSVLALCGNSGVILLSVKRQEHIDSAIPGRYTVQAPHKAGAGRGNPEFNIEHNRAHAVFSCHEHCYAQIMVGRAGPVSAGPGSMLTGISTPVRLTTYKVVESLGRHPFLARKKLCIPVSNAVAALRSPDTTPHQSRLFHV
ncbi:ash family protein, partial [Salmonella enterica]|uniref:ash family protein n=1 Tax=Salmonella enterica TaxID=28901 RepID=UPI0039BF6D3D